MSTTPLHFWTLLELSEALRTGKVSPVEATQAQLDRIAATEPKYHSYVTVLAEHALAAARVAEAEIGRGFWRGPLHGVPIAVKDLCYTSYAPTSGGMAIYADFVPPYSATVVDRLERAGAIILGKLKMTEGAYAAHHPSVVSPLNPWNANHWVGSSSSGSGSATASGQCYGSLGSDTGGSIRFPSMCCGITGLKPTWGRVSRYGVFALSDSLDHIGPMTRTAADAAAMLGAIAGADPNDPTAAQVPVPDYLATINGGVSGLRIGWDEHFATYDAGDDVKTALAEAARVLVGLGARLVPIKFPDPEAVLKAWFPFCAVEVAIAHKATFPARADDYGPSLRGLIESGHAVTGLGLGEALLTRQTFNGELAKVMQDVDVLLLPAYKDLPPTLEAMARFGDDDASVRSLLRYTAPFDHSRHPTITMKGGVSASGLPAAIQLVGQHFAEDVLLRAGHAFQRATDWHTRHPPGA